MSKVTNTTIGHYNVKEYKDMVPLWLQSEIATMVKPSSLLDPSVLFNQILAGLMLGDGHITRPVGNGNCHLSFGCAWKDHNLSMWVSVLTACHKLDLGTGQFAKSERFRNGKYSYNVIGYSQAHPLFTELRKFWYPGGDKCVPANIGEFLSPACLAFWFIGDGGSLGKCELALNSQGFSIPEQELLRAELLTKLGLKSRLGKDKIYKRIVLLAESSRTFSTMLRPLVHPSVHYKMRFIRTRADK